MAGDLNSWDLQRGQDGVICSDSWALGTEAQTPARNLAAALQLPQGSGAAIPPFQGPHLLGS